MNIDLFQKTLHTDGAATHRMVLVSMTDEAGRIGLGECAPVEGKSPDAAAFTMMSDVARTINEALNSADYADRLRPFPALLFALESALYDMTKSAVLYDTPFAHSAVPLPLSACLDGGAATMLQQVKRSILAGFRSVTVTVADEWDETLQWLRLLRSKYRSESLEIRLKASPSATQKTPDEWLSLLSALAPLGIHSVEQPLPAGQWKALATLCRLSPVPIALGAELTGLNALHEKQTLLDTVRPQCIVVRPMLHGGISGAMEWVSEAQKRGIVSWMASSGESNVGMRNIALLAARCYGPRVSTAQQIAPALYSDNIAMDMILRRGKLWREEVDEN